MSRIKIAQSIMIADETAGFDRLAVLDACDYYNEGQIITRINVPAQHRGQGYGRTMLKAACDAADAAKIFLFLEIAAYPDSPLQYDDLRSWYMRQGFRDLGGIFKRTPCSS